jgi:hypothetical protein
MAGNGPPPKDPKKRARTNKDVVPLRALPLIVESQPELPVFYTSTFLKDDDEVG